MRPSSSRGSTRVPMDTTPEAYAAQIEAYRRMGRETALAGIRARHPDYREEQARLALFRLILGDELTRAVWPGRDLVDP